MSATKRRLASPLFTGGGSVDCAAAAPGVRVHGCRANPSLVRFRQAPRRSPAALPAAPIDNALDMFGPKPLAAHAQEHRTDVKKSRRMRFTKGEFSEMTQAIDQPRRSVANQASFRSSMRGIAPKSACDEIARAKRLRGLRIPTLSLRRADFTDSIPSNPDAFIYADPPHRSVGARHCAGAENFALAAHRGQFAVSRNHSPAVRALHNGCRSTEPDFIHRTASVNGATRKSAEVAIRNYA